MTTLFVLTPSYFSQLSNGILIVFFMYILFSNFNTFLKSNYIIQLQLIGLLAIAIGIHGLGHLGLEKEYGYNPLLLFYNS